MGPGITLGLTLDDLLKTSKGKFDGAPKTFTVSLLESAGWSKDSQNTLVPWYPATKCDVIQVLSRLSTIRILGDWTTWYETVALDNVQIANTQGQLPTCAMSIPDASICTC